MSRRHRAEPRQVLPDPVYGDLVLTKFMNYVMYEGKKSAAEQIVYGALETVEKKLIQPTFILDYPRDISPFAKRVRYDDKHVERFEIYMAGMEMGNAFTELNDPRDQEARFIDMAQLYRADEDDATPTDDDYLRAMRFGMPPCGGFGMGVDRLVMLVTNQRSIRDVLLYPHLREEQR